MNPERRQLQEQPSINDIKVRLGTILHEMLLDNRSNKEVSSHYILSHESSRHIIAGLLYNGYWVKEVLLASTLDGDIEYITEYKLFENKKSNKEVHREICNMLTFDKTIEPIRSMLLKMSLEVMFRYQEKYCQEGEGC